jgi:transposase
VALEPGDFVKGFILSLEQQKRLRCELRQPTNAHVYRRAAALLALHEGRLAREVSALLGVTRQTIYNWMSCRGEGEQDLNLEDAPRTGRPSLWNGELDLLLEQTLQRSPRQLGYVATEWTAPLLRKQFSLLQRPDVSGETIRRRLRRLGYNWTEGRYTRQLDSKPN